MEKLLHSIPDVCERTDLGRSKVCELIASGELASVKVGRRRLVTAPALEEFVARLVDGQAVTADAS